MSSCKRIEEEVIRVRFKCEFDLKNLGAGQVKEMITYLKDSGFCCLGELADIIENK